VRGAQVAFIDTVENEFRVTAISSPCLQLCIFKEDTEEVLL
jgi:hypothetical protein